jgi:hypothetical protein
MENVICVSEENHGMIGVAKTYAAAVQGLVNQGWLNGNTEIYIDEYGNTKTIEEDLGADWLKTIRDEWDKGTFEAYFDGLFYLDTMEIWG